MPIPQILPGLINHQDWAISPPVIPNMSPEKTAGPPKGNDRKSSNCQIHPLFQGRKLLVSGREKDQLLGNLKRLLGWSTKMIIEISFIYWNWTSLWFNSDFRTSTWWLNLPSGKVGVNLVTFNPDRGWNWRFCLNNDDLLLMEEIPNNHLGCIKP